MKLTNNNNGLQQSQRMGHMINIVVNSLLHFVKFILKFFWKGRKKPKTLKNKIV